MGRAESERKLKQEINRRRAELGHTLDVPAEFWKQEAVRLPLAAAVEYAHVEGIDTDADDSLDDLLACVERAINAQISEEIRRTYGTSGSSQETSGHTAQSKKDQPLRPEPQEDWKVFSPDEYVQWGNERPSFQVERLCSAAASEFLVWHLNNDAFVRQFRRWALGDEDRRLTEPQAWRFITSPLVKVLSFSDYDAMGLCPLETVGQISLIADYDSLCSGPLEGLYQVVRASGQKHQMLRFVVEIALQNGDFIDHCVLRPAEGYTGIGLWPDQPLIPGAQVCCDVPPCSFFLDKIPASPQMNISIEGMRDSIVDEALAVCRVLSLYHPFGVWESLRLLLTGRIIDRPVSLFRFDYSAYTHRRTEDEDGEGIERAFQYRTIGPSLLLVQPWVSPEMLADRWRELRGGENRKLPQAHNLALFRFVLRHTPPARPFAWQDLSRRWSQENNKPLSRNAMQVIFKRTRDLLFPDFQQTE